MIVLAAAGATLPRSIVVTLGLLAMCNAPPLADPVPDRMFTVPVAAVAPLRMLTVLAPAVPPAIVTVDAPAPPAMMTVEVAEEDPIVIAPVD